jgi:HAMP domain-containing protein
MDDQTKLLEATRRLLDLKAEKKKYNAEINDQIKETEAEIKALARD